MLAKTEVFAPDLARLAEYAKALAHPARLRILQILSARDTCICGELVEELPLSQATVSRHLKTLKEASLIKGEIDGPRSCYCLDTDAIETLRSGLGTLLDDVLSGSSGPECC